METRASSPEDLSRRALIAAMMMARLGYARHYDVLIDASVCIGKCHGASQRPPDRSPTTVPPVNTQLTNSPLACKGAIPHAGADTVMANQEWLRAVLRDIAIYLAQHDVLDVCRDVSKALAALELEMDSRARKAPAVQAKLDEETPPPTACPRQNFLRVVRQSRPLSDGSEESAARSADQVRTIRLRLVSSTAK
jgi:hypothetical protein